MRTMNYDGARLRTRREANQLTRRQVVISMAGADRDITEETLRRWETGTTQPRADDLALLARILGCTVEDLFELDEEAA